MIADIETQLKSNETATAERLGTHIDRVVRAGSVPADGAVVGVNALAEYTKMTVTGHYLGSESIVVGPRRLDERPGFFLLTPFVLQEEPGSQQQESDEQAKRRRIIIVNRGWVPQNLLDNFLRESSSDSNKTITGVVRAGERGNRFVPAPEGRHWFSMDIARLAAEKQALPILLALTAEDSSSRRDAGRHATNGGYPVLHSGEVDIRNNHLSYIFTWFTLAICTAVAAVARIRAPQKTLPTVNRRLDIT